MQEATFKEEEQKLKTIIKQMRKEEEQIQSDLKKSDLKYDIEHLAQAQVMQAQVDKLDAIKQNIDRPYFARMDFKENGKELEKIYIGKMSLIDNNTLNPIIVDWRAPISNLYYEGKIGEASYECLGDTVEGNILLKRQYIIENQKLKKYVDINVTGNDELLQNALEEKADDRLKNIVATIQDNQNKIIRADINQPLIVQGVAGSGKTTIALHRIAYLIYTYEKDFNPEDFMIIAPTKFFLNYISNILPDLGVNDVRQCTFEDFAYDVIGKKLKISDNNEKLVIIVNKEFDSINKGKVDIIIKEAKYKSSLLFKNALDKYLKMLEDNYIPKEDFCFREYKIMSQKDIEHLFKDTYKMYNYQQREKEIEKNMMSELKKKSVAILEKIKLERSQKLYNLVGEERVREYDKYEEVISLLEKNPQKIIQKYFSKIQKKNSIEHYQEFIENFLEASDDMLEYLKNNTLNNLKRGEIAFEDLAPLMYIQLKVFGIKDKCKVKHVVIDEAQDYGEFQFYVLKTILNSNSMTILGDIAQGIHYYRGIENWNQFIESEFSGVKICYTTLDKTYRTTSEIMNVANNVISKLPEYEKEFIVLGDPVIDRKNSLSVKKVNDFDELIESINEKITIYQKNEYKSIAIIGKDMKECEEIEKKISKFRKDVRLIRGKDSEYHSGISIVPSYLAKGLEFDCVIISNAGKDKYTNLSLDIKLLYVVITRAMSKLDVFYMNDLSELLKESL